MRWVPRRVAALVVFGVHGIEPVQAAELRWSSPPECAWRTSAIQQVDALIGRPLRSVEDIDFEVAVVRASGESWRLSLVTIERAGGERRTREHAGRTCAEVVDSAAVSIAMVVRAGLESRDAAASEERQPKRAPEAPREGSPAQARQRPPSRPDSDSTSEARLGALASRAWLWSLALGGVGDAGALPEPALGAGLEVGIGWRKFRLYGTGSAFLPVTTRDTNDRGGEFGLLVAGALGCVEQPVEGWTAVGCGGYEIGRLSGTGVGVTDPRPVIFTWQALRVEAGARLPVAPGVGMLLRLGAAIPLERPNFVLDDTDVVHQPGRVAARALIALAATF